MSAEQRLEGLVLRSTPLGESDRLITVLSAGQGLVRLAAPGARKPKSSMAAAVPLALLNLQVGGRGDLKRVRQLSVQRNFAALAERLESLAAAQGLAEQTLLLVPSGDAVEGVLEDLLLQLGRLELVVKEREANVEALAIAVQGVVHLLALGGLCPALGLLRPQRYTSRSALGQLGMALQLHARRGVCDRRDRRRPARAECVRAGSAAAAAAAGPAPPARRGADGPPASMAAAAPAGGPVES